MHGQELLDAIGAMNSAQLQAFCAHDVEADDGAAALELENLLFAQLAERLGYDVRIAQTREAAIIVQLVEAMDIPTTWQMLVPIFRS